MLFDNLGRHVTIRFFRGGHYMLDGNISPAERLGVDVACRVTSVRG